MAPTASFFAEDGSLLMGYPDSPKRAGGLWLLVTFMGVCIGLIGLVSNILFLGDYKDDRTLYTDDKWDRPMSVSRDLYVHGCAGLLNILIIFTELEVHIVLNSFEFLRSFFARGVVYYFIGVMTYDEDKNGAKFEDHEYVSMNRRHTSIAMKTTALKAST